MTESTEPLHDALDAICKSARRLEEQLAPEIALVHPNYADSARNLVHYVALRNFDIRDVQGKLGALGLSSLSSCEQHVMTSLLAVRRALDRIGGIETSIDDPEQPFEPDNSRLRAHAADLLGAGSEGRDVAIMVTLPDEIADNAQLAIELLNAGMDVARINCAHNSPDTWRKMLDTVRQASEETGKPCKITMDLAGPKVRTGSLLPGPGVLRIRPRRDGLGHVIAPRRLRLVAEDLAPVRTKASVIPVPGSLIEMAEPGDTLRFRDTRGRRRQLKIVEKDGNGLVVEANKRAYLETGSKIRLHKADSGRHLNFRVGQLPPVDLPIILTVGDTLELDKKSIPGEPALVDSDGALVRPAHISCMPPEAIDRVPVGASVRFNDGKIHGVVEGATADGLTVRITNAKHSGSRLRGDRSINFPGTDLQLRGLTDTDRRVLDFAVAHTDAVSLSFVRSPADVVALQEELKRRAGRRPGIIPKIETEEAFQELPRILLAAMRTYPVGVMIARGDLAVECGWERLAEMQEEILWMCEAAHIPVIWATQVLEGEAKKGRPSRAEITDAAMSQRADCVMLNKGPHIIGAIRMLDNILRRMQDHQQKKAPTLRRLSISDLR